MKSQYTLGDGLEPIEVLDVPGVSDGGQGGVMTVRRDEAHGGHQLHSLESHLRLIRNDGSNGEIQ